jgi:hypothetical protein
METIGVVIFYYVPKLEIFFRRKDEVIYVDFNKTP